MSAATNMRPLTTMGAWNLETEVIPSPAPPPLKTLAPVSPSNETRRLLPRPQTTASERPSVVVTMGEPGPACAHHPTEMVGGEVTPILIVDKSVNPPPGHMPLPLKAK